MKVVRKKGGGDPIAQEQGRRLRLAREAKSRQLGREFTQREVAEAADMGLTLEAYGSYERGRHRIPEEYLQPIARVLDVSPYYLQGLPEPKPLRAEAALLADIANEIQNPQSLALLIDVAKDQLRLDRSLRQADRGERAEGRELQSR